MCRCGAQLAHDSYSASCGTVQQESWLLTLSARTVNRSPMNKTKMYWTAELLLQLLGAPGIATRSEDLVGAPGLTTRSKKLLGAPGIAPQGSAWMALQLRLAAITGSKSALLCHSLCSHAWNSIFYAYLILKGSEMLWKEKWPSWVHREASLFLS